MIVINVIVGPVRWIREFLFSIIGDISSSVFIYLVVVVLGGGKVGAPEVPASMRSAATAFESFTKAKTSTSFANTFATRAFGRGLS